MSLVGVGSGGTGLTEEQEEILNQVANYPPIEVAVVSDDVITIAGSATSPVYLSGFYKIGAHNAGIEIVNTNGTDEGALLNNTGRDFCMCGEFNFTSTYSAFQGEVAVWSERSADGVNWTPNTKSFRRWDVSIVSEGSNSQPSYIEEWLDGEYIRFCMFLDGSGTLTFEPTSEVVNGSFTVESFGCMWRLSEVPVDVNAEQPIYYEYTFDGIDDNAVAANSPVILNDGDVIKFYSASGGDTGTAQVLLYSDTNSQKGRLFESSSGGVLTYSNYTDLKIDGVSVSSGTTAIPDDGEAHLIEITATSGSESLKYIGSNPDEGLLKNGIIRDISITRANPTNENPDLSWPINEGPGATVGIEANGNSEYNLVYNNFDDENWSEI